MRILTFIAEWILQTFEWLPFMSFFILIGALVYGFLSHAVGEVMMSSPLVFTLLKAWAETDNKRWF